MKKILYAFLFVFSLICATDANAQYHITGSDWLPRADSGYFCNEPILRITTNAYNSALSIKSFYGNGESYTSTLTNGGSFGYLDVHTEFTFPGTYTTKHVLYNGTSPVDSIVTSHEYFYCSSVILKTVYDVFNTGIYDINDPSYTMPAKIEVSHNGIIIDTVSSTSGDYYPVEGSLGDIYSFKIILGPSGLNTTFPAGGIIYDTIRAISNSYVTKYFGFHCSSSASYDLAVNAVIPVTGVNDQWGDIYVTNNTCDPTNGVVTLNFSPKYIYRGNARPAPSSVSGNTITWDLTGVRANAQIDLYYAIWANPATGVLTPRDTVQEHVKVTPTTGDSNPTNNIEIVIDTVRAGCDPNEMEVSPIGNIHAGSQLKYTIAFENTGNDTAFNISVYDTLSDNVDPKSLEIVMASAAMNIAILNKSGVNIVKFDFPNINLLDSSHHGLCNGAVIFTINARAGLPYGTTIFNHAGIFFDYNAVVMTDTVENIIGTPAAVATVPNTEKVSIYPNPANDLLTITADNHAYSTATITNTMGQTVKTHPITSAQTVVNVKSLPAGMYYIALKGEGGVKVVKFEKM